VGVSVAGRAFTFLRASLVTVGPYSGVCEACWTRGPGSETPIRLPVGKGFPEWTRSAAEMGPVGSVRGGFAVEQNCHADPQPLARTTSCPPDLFGGHGHVEVFDAVVGEGVDYGVL
jgi:hypothetical protein